MTVFIAAFIVFSLAMLGLSIGVVFSDNVKIKGHCGGEAKKETLSQCIRGEDGRKIVDCDHCDCE